MAPNPHPVNATAVEEDDNRASSECSPLLGGEPPLDASPKSSQEWAGYADFAGLPWYKRPSVYWLLPPFFLWTLAFGGVIVPKINLILSLICRQYLVDHAVTELPALFDVGGSECRQNSDVEVLVTKFTMYMSVISGLMSALLAPHLGALSDRYGRKPILVYTAMGTLISEVIVISCVKYAESLSYAWILLGSFFEGCSGGFIAGMAITHSYATDCTAPSKRAVTFGYFHGCLFGGVALGPFMAGYLIKLTGDLLSIFYFALACQCVFICALMFVIPEALTVKRQMEARERYQTECDRAAQEPWSVKHVLKTINIFKHLAVLYPTDPGSSSQVRVNLLLLATIDTIIFGIAMSSATILAVYTIFQFGWGNFQTSMFVSAANVTRVTALIIVLPILNRFIRARVPGYASLVRNTGCDKFEIGTIRFAVFLETLGYIGYSLSRTPAPFVVSGLLAAFGGIASPTLQSALTKHVPVHRTGEMLGAMGLLHATARVVAPTATNLIYASTAKVFPQAVFVVLACFFGLGMICTWFIKPYVYLEDDGLPPPPRTSELDQDPMDDEVVNA